MLYTSYRTFDKEIIKRTGTKSIKYFFPLLLLLSAVNADDISKRYRCFLHENFHPLIRTFFISYVNSFDVF